MLIQLIVYIVNWFLAMIISWLPVMVTTPVWLSSMNIGISNAWNMLDGIVNMNIILPFFVSMILIVIAYEIFHFTHQTALAVGKGVSIDKSHL